METETIASLKEVVEDQKRKISTLKKAFLQKQEEHKKTQQIFKDGEMRIAQLEQTLAESRQTARNLEVELQGKAEEISHFQNLLKGLANGTAEQQTKKLLEEYLALKIAYSRLEESTKATQVELHHTMKREFAQNADSEETMQLLRTELQETSRKLEVLQAEHLMTCKTNVQLSDKNSKLEEEAEQLRRQLREQKSELALRDFALKGKQDIILALNESLLRHGDSEAVLAEELMSVKNALIEARSFYQKYDVTLINTITTTQAKLILKLDPSGELMLEVEPLKGSKRVFSSRTVESVNVHATRPTRVVVTFIGEKKLEVESQNAGEMARNLREVIFRRTSSG